MDVDDLMAIQPVIPVIVIERADDAVPLAEALVAGGLRVLEVTLRTDCAIECIRRMTKVPNAIVGAGTCLFPEDIDVAVDAGAQFIVTPGLSQLTLAAAMDRDVPVLPGVATASEIMAGLGLGLDRFKFFPAQQAGGLAMIDALGGPFKNVKFCPTGGINLELAKDYLARSNVGCVGGGWVAPKKLVDAKDWAGITALATAAAALKRPQGG